MKRLFCVLLVTVYVSVFGYADGFLRVHSPNGLHVWAVGFNGRVFQSVDGGATWSNHTQGTGTLRGVHALGSSVWIVGDNGKHFFSSNSGSTWSEQTLNGAATLNDIVLIDNQTGFIVGNSGVIFKTINGGAIWESKTSTTSQKLNAVAFSTPQIGYAVGNAGVVLKTVDAGESWSSIGNAGWTNDLTGVSVSGSTVYVTGVNGFCVKSVNSGASWSALNFMTDSYSDVNAVFAKSDNEAVFVGGGGYVRLTNNGGTTFTWGRHTLHGTLNSVFFYDAMNGWACSDKNNVVLRTTDGGANWSLPTGTTVSMNWVQKLSISATVRGNAFSMHPSDKNIIYCALGTRVYASYDRGETWVQIATMPAGGSKVNSFYVSPKDSNLWVAAYGAPDRIVRTTDRGVTWTATTPTMNFSEYGMPLEMDGSHPDTLIFGPEDGHIWRSTDFGATWTDWSNPGFRSPCDIVVVRDEPDVIWVGDGVTGSGQGQMFRSRDGGRTFQLIYTTTGSEIPTTVGSSLDNKVGYATAWGSGGVNKTADMGLSWNSVATTGSAWGVDIAKDDPNVMMFGVYGGSTSYLSSNAASSFLTSPLTGSNYAIFAYDRGTFLAQQSGGIYKYNFTYVVPSSNLQTLALTAPSGGEIWAYGTTRNIAWNSSNIANVKIEYKTAPASAWQTVVANTPGAMGTYAWQIPATPTTQARVRISDVGDNTPIDSSQGVFSITVAAISAQPGSLDFGSVVVGSTGSQILTLTNNGTAALIVSSVTATDPAFIAGRTSFTIPAGQSDTLSVLFSPGSAQAFAAQLTIGCNVPGSPYEIPVSGTGLSNATLALLSPNGGEVWNVNSTQTITWSATNLDRVEISYKASPTGSWIRIAQNVTAALGSFEWLVPNAPSTQARVMIVDRSSGTLVDSSDGFFTIFGPTSVATGGVPTEFELSQNYPNPFNPATTIEYGVPEEAFVSLKVYNMIGQEVATLVNERQSAGRYVATFDAQKLTGSTASGMYFYRFTAGSVIEIRKMMLLK
ncbi:MAG: choice-of-anchor D domain-containing protein [Bacteroidetes bacterium]|nr:choice-of-anchor D domain-containing protein [Bacteroidota bacterium]MCW5894455.1 choice-of-anchor D domain-containing protein [Bacteroidota bacterium]